MTLFTVIGNPVAHSLSPQIHQLFAQQFGIELRYTRTLSAPEQFDRTVREFFRAGGTGANITVPFKQGAVALCSELSKRAQAAGAVNTMQARANGELYGDNTDGAGLVSDLTHQVGQLAAARVVIVGAGGATRGVLLPLLEAGVVEIVIANRTVDHALALRDHFATAYNAPITAIALNQLTPEQCHQAIIVNATSTAWSGEPLAINHACFAQARWVYDMNYGAQPTAFLQQAMQAGAPQCSDGLGMLVEQAALSFSLWHAGLMPATQLVLQQLRQNLG